MDEHALTRLRAELRSADSELIRALARRTRLVKKIGMLKQKLEIGVVDPAAERSVMENFVASAEKEGVEERTARCIAELLIEASVDLQMQRRSLKASKDSLLKQLSQKGRKLIRLDIEEPRFKTPPAAAHEAKRYLSQKAAILYGSSAGLPLSYC
jgi:chorismate mutase